MTPLFPLPDVWLFPMVVMPLHVFEERYRQMIEDSLDGPGRIVIGTVQAGHEGELADAPPVYPVAGLGEIGRHERLDDGRFQIWMVGLKRVRIQEVTSERLYRKVAVQPTEEVDVPVGREEALREELGEAIRARTGDEAPPNEQLAVARLVDFLTLRIPLPHEAINRIYCELDVEKRAQLVLEEHRTRPEGEE